VAETNAIAVELEHARFERFVEPDVSMTPDRRSDELDSRLGEAPRGPDNGECRPAQPVETLADERTEVGGERQLLAGSEPSAAPLERVRQLEREERVPAGRLPDAPHCRTRDEVAEPVA
jgi:hypothetical protein